MQIEINIPHPKATILMLFGVAVVASLVTGTVSINLGGNQEASLIAGGSETAPVQDVYDAEEGVRRAREQHAVLERKEEILRFQLRELERVRESLEGEEDSELYIQLSQSRDRLVELLRDKQKAEDYLLQSLKQLWDAQLRAGRASTIARGTLTEIAWPVEPIYGISAGFHDPEYEEIFGIPHEAIDIPIEQGSRVSSAADGVIEKIADNGMGYNYAIVRHKGGATLYGHVTVFLVKEGQNVKRGQSIALSGGRPGSKGAGALSTGPHLHFEVIVDGEHIDPMTLLPKESI